MLASPVLCICAHTDDETLGCGATLHRLAQAGHRVVVNWLSYGIAPREAEHEMNPQRLVRDSAIREDCMPLAMRRLGITEYTRIGQYPTAQLDTLGVLVLARVIEATLSVVKPQTILTHWWGDPHQDHRSVFNAVQIATRMQPPKGTWRQSVRTILCFEVLSSTDYVLQEQFQPTVFVPVSGVDIHAKVEAMRAYRTEIRPPPHPRSPHGIRALATTRGMQVGERWAEGFVLARSVLP